MYLIRVLHTYLVEEVLQLFIGQVDTDLLEAVLVKLLETKDVQNS